jgi:exosortase
MLRLMHSSAERTFFAALLWTLSVLAYLDPLTSLLNLAFQDERFTHILVTPIITVALICLKRKHIFRHCDYCPSLGIPILLLGFTLWYTLSVTRSSLTVNDRLAFLIAPIILSWIGVFILCYGMRPFRAALFPLFFLFFMLPPPSALLSQIVLFLQKGSAEFTEILFTLAGVPVYRQEFTFALPGVDIEIAEQCSGIRSSLSLFLSGVLSSYLFIHSAWKRACLILVTIPIAIFKNALRIVTISWLGIYVDSEFFHGGLHTRGGLPFSLLALAMLGLFLFVLRDRVPASIPSRGSPTTQTAP